MADYIHGDKEESISLIGSLVFPYDFIRGEVLCSDDIQNSSSFF